MYKIILVPFDGSAVSAQALPIAAALAQRTGARLHVAMVHDPSAYIPFVPGEVSIPVYDAELVRVHRDEEQQKLTAAVAELERSGTLASGVLLEGTVVEALVEHANATAVDLTVMCTHGRGGLQRLRLGSVATAFLTRATAPVLLVRDGAAQQGEREVAPLLPSGPLLCAVDGSAFSEAVIPHAIAFAQATGMSLALLSVSVPHPMPMAPFGAEALLADDSALTLEEAGRLEYLNRICRACPEGSSTQAVTDMSVSRAIVEQANELGAGALAMATHGRGGFKRLMLGSVADDVIRHSTLPVLVYRPV